MAGPLRETGMAHPLRAAESYRAGALVALLRLHWFIRLRWLFVGIALGVLAIERFTFPAAQRPWQLLIVVLCVASVNVVWTIISRILYSKPETGESGGQRASPTVQTFANAQVAADLLLLTGIVHYTGGVENPMSVFYLFHVAISALLLKTWQAALQCAWTIVLYGTIILAEWQGWVAHYALIPQRGPLGVYRQPEYAILFVGVTAAAIVGTLYFTLRIARLLDTHERQLQQANAALRKSQLAIQDLQHRRARFMQMAAHQLKSPLAIVQTLANLIRDGIVSDHAAVQATCEKITRRAQDGIVQVSELLTLARVQEADPARQRQDPLDTRTAVLVLCQHYRPLAERKQIELTCWTPPDDDLFIYIDAQDFKDCVGNLIENAIKYTPSPGRVRVAVTAKRDAGRPISVAIHVSDSGIGFDPQLLRAKTLGEQPVFDAFRRGANAVAAGIPGTGLGLSIVREVVEQAGGQIWLMSRPGVGSSFTLTFPASGAGAEGPPVRDTRATEVVLETPPGDPELPRAATRS